MGKKKKKIEKIKRNIQWKKEKRKKKKGKNEKQMTTLLHQKILIGGKENEKSKILRSSSLTWITFVSISLEIIFSCEIDQVTAMNKSLVIYTFIILE